MMVNSTGRSTAMQIRPADLDDPQVIALLETHVSRARSETGAGSAHALDLEQLRVTEISLWSAWRDNELLAIGALKRLDSDHGEVKSMHTAEAARRSGAGSAILRHIIATARADGLARLSLETGSWPYFKPAHAFYQAHGFSACGRFADYQPDPNSLFMTLAL